MRAASPATRCGGHSLQGRFGTARVTSARRDNARDVARSRRGRASLVVRRGCTAQDVSRRDTLAVAQHAVLGRCRVAVESLLTSVVHAVPSGRRVMGQARSPPQCGGLSSWRPCGTPRASSRVGRASPTLTGRCISHWRPARDGLTVAQHAVLGRRGVAVGSLLTPLAHAVPSGTACARWGRPCSRHNVAGFHQCVPPGRRACRGRLAPPRCGGLSTARPSGTARRMCATPNARLCPHHSHTPSCADCIRRALRAVRPRRSMHR